MPTAKAVAAVVADGDAPLEVVADPGYASAGAAAELEAAGVVAILPMHHGRTPPGYFPRDRFTYADEADHYVCPAGQVLRRFSTKPDKDGLARGRQADGAQKAPGRSHLSTLCQ